MTYLTGIVLLALPFACTGAYALARLAKMKTNIKEATHILCLQNEFQKLEHDRGTAAFNAEHERRKELMELKARLHEEHPFD